MNLAAVRGLVAHHARLHWRVLTTMAAAVGLFQFLLTRFAPAPEDTEWFRGLLALTPANIRALAGGDLVLASTDGFLALGYVHPFFIVLLSVWVVRVSSAALAGEIGRGTIDLLSSRPVRRSDLVAAGAVTIALGLTLMMAAAWSGTAIGLVLRPLGVSVRPFVQIAAAAWLLFMAWGAIGLVVSALEREAGPAIAWTAALMAVSFVLDYVARLWSTIAALRPLSLFAHYQPADIVHAGWPWRALGLFAVTWVAAIALALGAFSRRDL